MGDAPTVISTEHLFKVFGPRPERALGLLEGGADKDAVFRATGLGVGVQDASFDVREGEIFVVMGLSGSGKSTLLRLLNRLIEPTSGVIRVGGRDLTRMHPRELTEIRRRDLGMVFQSFALLPHLSVEDNVAFGLAVSGMGRAERRERARDTLAVVGLDAYAESMPASLSGGMQQRVGLARALASEPRVLLMDEAFSALDPLIRSGMQDELLRLHEERGLTIVFISHDLDEAMKLGDRIAIMDEGRILQIGAPEEILRAPADPRVRDFFGGVDVTRVLTAGDLARPEPSVFRGRAGDLHAALACLGDEGRSFGYVQDEEGRFLGVLSTASLKDAIGQGAAGLESALLPVEPVPATTPYQGTVSHLSRAPCPLPVTDEAGRLVGTLSKTQLLERLAETSR
jgi:glycine betaine/proline transport system ATP-binding protein